MAYAIPIDVYDLLEDKLGREDARRVASAIEVSLETIKKEADTVALQKKLELKDELTKELATKADLLVLEKKIEAEIIKWMFLFWIGQLVSFIAILKFFKF
jgi:hypothetical protein